MHEGEENVCLENWNSTTVTPWGKFHGCIFYRNSPPPHLLKNKVLFDGFFRWIFNISVKLGLWIKKGSWTEQYIC